VARAALAAAVLTAGGLYPLLRLQPWTAFWERRAVLETLERHPKVKLLRLDAEHGPRLRVEIRVPSDDVAQLIAFRKALKNDPLLSKYEIQAEVAWRISGEREPTPPGVECTFFVQPKER